MDIIIRKTIFTSVPSFLSDSVDCFSRLYREAMIPPNRVFRTSETNSVQTCKGQCIEEGMRCQSFALGISMVSGNGTCQLSSERVFENGGRRPRNTIYDPEFNLYQRIENCYDQNGSQPKPEGSLVCGQLLRELLTMNASFFQLFLHAQKCQRC